jgi:small-conductance mechanosensitive channel
MASFVKGVLQIVVFLLAVIQVASMSDTLKSFGSTILMSSSLLVVVMGFVFQEGLSNIVHGYIIAFSKSFEIGDRVEVYISGDIVKGYVKTIGIRHTVVTNIMDNADIIIPNSVIDTSVIRNLNKKDSFNRYPLTVSITYEDAQNPEKLSLAKEIFVEEVLANPRTIESRKSTDQPIFVKVDFADSAVTLTCFVDTNTAEENYYACSEIKEKILERYGENNIAFAYNHLELCGSIETVSRDGRKN